jgi:hypothetical protein
MNRLITFQNKMPTPTDSKLHNAALFYRQLFVPPYYPSDAFPPYEQYLRLPEQEQYKLLDKELIDILAKTELLLKPDYCNCLTSFDCSGRQSKHRVCYRVYQLRMMHIFFTQLIKYPNPPHNMEDLVNYLYNAQFIPDFKGTEVKAMVCTKDKPCNHPIMSFSIPIDERVEKEFFEKSKNSTPNKEIAKTHLCSKGQGVPNINYKQFCVGCNSMKKEKLLYCGKCKKVAYCNVRCTGSPNGVPKKELEYSSKNV